MVYFTTIGEYGKKCFVESEISSFLVGPLYMDLGQCDSLAFSFEMTSFSTPTGDVPNDLPLWLDDSLLSTPEGDLQPLFPTNSGCTEEHWYSLRRCNKCKLFYTQADNEDPGKSCFYHPGKYVDISRLKDSPSIGWTCCRKNSNHPKHLNFESIGCTKQEKHTEDCDFTSIMKKFPFDPNANRDEQLKRVIDREMDTMSCNTSKNIFITPKLEELLNHPDYITHTVTKYDTLAGLSLKYKTTRETLRRINRMPNDLVFQKDFIFIPKTERSSVPIPSLDFVDNHSKVTFFVSKTGCAPSEAKYYLEDTKWNLDSALENWREDMNWSTATPKPPLASLKLRMK